YRPLTVADVNSDSGSVIGYPIPDLTIYVLDQHFQPLPIGIPGEMYVGGAGVARGYLNRPELTDQRFIHDPFNPAEDARLYKTGDLARYLSNGDLEYLGRIDHQVKVRGFRIELGEIEANLRQHPALRDALVLAREDTPGNKRLVAYVVTEAGEQVNIQALRPFLKDRLPDYMLPTACIVLKALPLTPNGKIDRKALPAPESSERTGEERYAPPTLIEHYELIGIWEELLNIHPIGIRDNFFDLGGHSLLAAQLINRIELVFSKKIPLAAFYSDPTIERLAHLLEQQEMNQEMPVVPVQVGGSRRPFFYLHGDLIGGAWYCFPLARRLGPEQPFYSIQPYQFDGKQAPPTFEAMAADHLQSLQAIQPEGPYLLGGFCFGGLLAYEMARQLQVQGQQVDLLVLINPTSPAPLFDKLLRSIVSLLGKLPGLGEKQAFLTFLWARHFYKYVRFSDYRRAANKAERKSGKGSSPLAYLRAIFPKAETLGQGWGAMNSWVLSAYQPGSYSDNVTFFWAEEEMAESRKWRKPVATAKATDFQVIPGSHLGCLREHLPVLAEELDKRIREAQGVEGSVPL
ncbi:MAG TPA: alpha/beta fold hydrolase, partial [Ktedonobacteraceae bacterium]|nr:alpha/beta fold hydrolase [Ktedonobacteraceae bacterium]